MVGHENIRQILPSQKFHYDVIIIPVEIKRKSLRRLLAPLSGNPICVSLIFNSIARTYVSSNASCRSITFGWPFTVAMMSTSFRTESFGITFDTCHETKGEEMCPEFANSNDRGHNSGMKIRKKLENQFSIFMKLMQDRP